MPVGRLLKDSDMVLLLTPVVVPPRLDHGEEPMDPFEPLGRSLSQLPCRVRHVPYIKTQGITGAHVTFIRRAALVLLVVSGLADPDGASQLGLAEMVADACEDRLLVVLACCDVPHDKLYAFDVPTLIQASGFNQPDLDALSSLLIHGESRSASVSEEALSLSEPSTYWPVQQWDPEQDLAKTRALWSACMPARFALDMDTLASLLRRDSYARHHIVRDPSGRDLVAFCATYTTYAGAGDDHLVGCIAAIMVRQDWRGRGVGRALHDISLDSIRRIRGVDRVQLGSVYPRLIPGLLTDLPDAPWFQNRGWTLTEPVAGKGRILTDQLLRFEHLPTLPQASAGLSFRQCEITEVQQVLDMVRRESLKKPLFGWYDQYARTADSAYMDSIIVGFEGSTLVAAAITYLPHTDSRVALDMPWPRTIGPDIGGVTCICIKGTRLHETRPRH